VLAEIIKSFNPGNNYMLRPINSRRRPSILVLMLACLGTIFFLASIERFIPSTQAEKSADEVKTESQERRVKSDIEKSIKQYQLVKLDRTELASRVRSTGKLSFATSDRSYEIKLTPNDLRAPNYRAEEVRVDGQTYRIESGPVHTYKGTVLGMEGAEARFTIDDKGVEGLIAQGGATYFIEPASRYSSSAASGDFVFYNSSDVLEDAQGECGATLSTIVDARAESLRAEKSPPHNLRDAESPAANVTTARIVELATEADYEHVTASGSSAKANQEILSVMNQVDGIYKAEFGITFTIVYQHTWATSDDPYTSLSAISTLNEFTNYWKANKGDVARDLAHMWTARLVNDYIGYAWIGVVCNNPNFSYALSLMLTRRAATLTAHEFGHNFGATHIDTTSSCDNTIMVSNINSSTAFCDFSRNQINTHINNNSACLSVSPTNCSYGLSSTGQSFGTSAGTGSVNVTADTGCNWIASSNTSWISIVGVGNSDSGLNYVGNGNSTVNYDVSANNGYTRKGTISIAGRAFTVTQAGALPECSVHPISIGQTVNGTLSTSDCGAMWKSYFSYTHRYSFNGLAGQQVQISLGSNDFSPDLYLTGPDGTRVASSNQNGGTANAYIPSSGSLLTLPLTGTYTLEVTSFDGKIGNYTLTSNSPCTYSISPASKNFPSGSGTGSVSVTTTSGCNWTATSNDPSFITITGGAGGTGNGTVNYAIAANTTAIPRSGTLSIAGQPFIVSQDGINCSFSLSSNSQNYNASGGPGSVNVTATTGCAWTAASNASWIALIGGSNGNGSGPVSYTVAANTGVERIGTITIAGLTFTITQASGCTYSINPTARNHVSGGGNGTISLTTDATCPWTAAGNSPFITITSGASGTGSTTVSYSVSANVNTGSRTGTLTIAGQTFTVTQDAAPPPRTIQLSQASYTVDEGAGSLDITVTRSGDTSAPASVKYATGDATDVNFRCDPSTPGQATIAASRKCDYHIAAGTLRFAAGEATRQFTLSIIDDVYVEIPEALTITLSNPVGGTLGENSTAVVTITNNDTYGSQNPIDNTRFFVRQLYVDLLSREPEPGGWNGWTTRIDRCGQPDQPPPPCDRVTVSGDGFLRSGEFFDRQFFVLRLYRTGLGRILRYEDVGDLAYVSGFLTDAALELNKQDLVNEIMARAEFSSRYNGLSDLQFVESLLQTAGITVPADVRQAWITSLGGTKSRAQVYREVSERPEVSAKYLHEAQVVSAYYGFFTRNPDGAYLNYLQRLDAGEINLSDLANAFINASEYRLRFGQ
jgi:hypothetical protein